MGTGPSHAQRAEAGLWLAGARKAGARRGGAKTRGHTPLPKVPALLARGAADDRLVTFLECPKQLAFTSLQRPGRPTKAVDLANGFAICAIDPVISCINCAARAFT